MGHALSEEELVTTERVGVVVYRLMRGEAATTLEIATWTGLTRTGAWLMMEKLSRVLPLAQVEGRWCAIDFV
jgi:hypothetical protein